MNVVVAERGHRPLVLTKSRRYAPAAAKVLGEHLGAKDFADSAAILVDWQGDWQFDGGEVPEGYPQKPILYIEVNKWVHDFNENLKIEARLDVDEVFTSEAVTGEYLADVVHELEEKVRDSIEQRKSEGW